MQPGAERLPGLEAIDGAIRVEEALLNGVLGVFMIRQDGSTHAIRPPLMPPDQLGECEVVAAAHGSDHLVLLRVGVNAHPRQPPASARRDLDNPTPDRIPSSHGGDFER
jgi:hypothetical protein